MQAPSNELTLAVALLIAITGCTQTVETVEPLEVEAPPALRLSELPSDDLFQAAALGAAGTVQSYLERSDLITSEGGVAPERMASLVTPEWYPKEVQGFARFTTARERTLGQTTMDNLQVQLARQLPGGGLDVGVIACVDATKVLVLGLEDADPPAEVLEWQGEWESFDGTAEEWEVIEGFWATTSARWGERDAVVFWLLGASTEELLVDHTEQWWGISRC